MTRENPVLRGIAIFLVGAVAGVGVGYLAFHEGRETTSTAPTGPTAVPDTTSAASKPRAPALPPGEASRERHKDLIVIDLPADNAWITSPVTVIGKARGPWFFEAEFPVRLLDERGDLLSSGSARAVGEWMTSDFVTFSASLPFVAPKAVNGTLVLERSNPSGLPEHAGEVRIPVRFR